MWNFSPVFIASGDDYLELRVFFAVECMPIVASKIIFLILIDGTLWWVIPSSDCFIQTYNHDLTLVCQFTSFSMWIRSRWCQYKIHSDADSKKNMHVVNYKIRRSLVSFNPKWRREPIPTCIHSSRDRTISLSSSSSPPRNVGKPHLWKSYTKKWFYKKIVRKTYVKKLKKTNA